MTMMMIHRNGRIPKTGVAAETTYYGVHVRVT